MKVRAANKLLRDGFRTRRIRTAFSFLDDQITDWFLLPLHRFSGHVLVELNEARFISATGAGQSVVPEAVSVVRQLTEEGPLGEMQRFSEYIDMDPAVMGGNPVLRGTRIEPRFIFELSRRSLPPAHIADSYHLSSEQMRNALEFGEATAA